MRTAKLAKLRQRGLQERLDVTTARRATVADRRNLAPLHFRTNFGFLFVHDLARIQLDVLLRESHMPATSSMPAGCAMGALLELKLWGLRRSSPVMAEALDPGLALFAGLGAMPERSTLTEYSSRVHPGHCRRLMEAWHQASHALGVPPGGGHSFDLDFHTIAYHGDDALIQRHYISKRSRSQNGILSLVAHDAEARLTVYVDAQIRKEDRHDQLLRFVDFWRERTGSLPHALVFDSTFTTYANLARLQAMGIAFLSLRRRSRKMVAALAAIPQEQWRRLRLSNVGRTFRTPRILEEKVQLRDYPDPLRQVTITDIGHDKPTLLLTNQMDVPPARLIERYVRRPREHPGGCHRLFLHGCPQLCGTHEDRHGPQTNAHGQYALGHPRQTGRPRPGERHAPDPLPQAGARQRPYPYPRHRCHTAAPGAQSVLAGSRIHRSDRAHSLVRQPKSPHPACLTNGAPMSYS